MSNTHTFRGMNTTEHYFQVPLDHARPAGEKITVFAREISSTEHTDPASLPWLLFLQGGPGGKSPRPASLSGWLAEAAKTFRILLLDQRGTGLSTPANRQSLPMRGDAAAQAAYLTHFRADSIVRDAEAIRKDLGIEKWSTFGQSYGGFCTLTYLSLAPAALERCIVTGGLASLTADADTVYRATYRRMAERNAEYFEWYPQDRKVLREIVAHLAHTEEHLPGGRALTVPLVQMLGQFLGGNARVHSLHHVFEAAFIETPGGRRLSDTFLAAVAEQADRTTNPLYALLHESIYAQGAATNWSAQRVLAEFPAFSPDAELPLLTGEMVFSWYFEDDAVLRPLEETARILAEHEDWGPLYDPTVLAANTVPVAAAVYAHDVYVDRDLSLQTAAAVGNVRVWETEEFHHDGIGDEGAMIFAKLLELGKD
ncbi:alpha/beta fold hydrolase [Paeniglutamicibacter psychrophenolicus]|uniref:alpha/beta fold hydrolase n=1 Tax=Paeniglutamicibacter psychrophenolicus TaxID=257454 RepID=UPI00277ECB05|nr:alpha/beta fold hydrolase [Paeniglutamicibacter psychrophenolicus]MDQ0094124.1 proline iminopeptidase [Paeniglutamicibacter psychrophenolicus]